MHIVSSTNVLSFAEVEDRFPITYIPRESFTVHSPDHDVMFARRGKMHVADWEEVRSAFAITVYRAYDLLHTSGYPSMSEAIHLYNGRR